MANRNLHRLLGDARRYQGQLEIRGGYGMLQYWPDVEGAPQNTIIGRRDLWVLRDRPRAEYKGVAKFLRLPFEAEIQARGIRTPAICALPGGVRFDPRARFLRSQSRHRDFDRADQR